MSATGCSLHLSRRPPSSDLPRATDILGVRRHVSKGRIPDITRLSDQVVNDPKRRGLAITYVARFGPTLETTLRALDAAGTPENVKAFGRRPPNTRRWPSKRPASETFHRSCRSSDLLRSGMQFPPARSATIKSTRSQTVVV
jgi:hypothetical protein